MDQTLFKIIYIKSQKHYEVVMLLSPLKIKNLKSRKVR